MAAIGKKTSRIMQGEYAPGASAVLKVYKATLSHVFAVFGAQCRHLPTCSEYAAGCVSCHGVWPGAWMALARLSRCHPLGSSGFDPVPEHRPHVPAWQPWRYGDWSWRPRPVAPSAANSRLDCDAEDAN